MVYNETFMNTSTNLLDIFNGVNIATNGLLSIVLLVVVFIMVYAGSIKNGTTAAFMASSFVTTIISVLMWWAGMIGWAIVVVPASIFLIALGLRFFQGGQ